MVVPVNSIFKATALTAAVEIGHGTFGYGPAHTHPFGSPWLVFLDLLRVMVFCTLGLAVVATIMRWRDVDTSKKFLMCADVVGLVICFETEWDNLGAGVGRGGRLWLVCLLAFLSSGWAITAILKEARIEAQRDVEIDAPEQY